MWRAADTKARAGSDMSPEESECVMKSPEYCSYTVEAAGQIFTVTTEQLWKRQKNLQVKKHPSEGNLIKTDDGMKL